MAIRYRIDIENSSGTVQGSGPITSASFWESTAEMDRAGSFSFAMPAADGKASLIQERYVARCYALLNSTWTEIGAGVIDDISLDVGADGEAVLAVSGMGIARELSQRSVRNLELASAGTFITHSAAITAIDAYSPAGWTITPAGSPPNDNVYGRFAGESVLNALLRAAEKTRTHFYYAGDRTLVFADSFSDSGVRAIQARGDLAAGLAAITALRRIYDSYDLRTRIIPYGAGQGDTRLTLAAANRTPASGYSLDTANNYIENDTATATYGLDEIALEFKDVGPVSNSDADVQAASNALYDAAYEWLRRYSQRGEFYELALAECDTVLRPMQSIRVSYRDERQNIDIDTDLNILGATLRIDAEGLRTTRLTVGSLDRWPEDDTSVLVGRMQQGQMFQALPQLNANSYVTAYNKNIDDTETATVRFRFGDEVTQLQQVLFEFQLLPFESTVLTVALDSMTGGAGELETDPAASSMGAISNNSSGSSSPNETGGASTNETGSAAPVTAAGGGANTGSGGGADTGGKSLTSATGGGSDTGSAAPTTGTTAPDTGGAAPSTSSVAVSVSSGGGDDTSISAPVTGLAAPTTAGTSLTSANSAPDTGEPQGYDSEPAQSNRHYHTFEVFDISGGTGPNVLIDVTNAQFFFSGSDGDPVEINTWWSGRHTHGVDSHTHTTVSHNHTTPSHSHATANHSHTTAGHTHGTTAHTHTSASHSHTTISHAHTTPGHSHTTASHSHTTASHTHTIPTHTHTTLDHIHTTVTHTHAVAAHTHTITHTHSLNNHTHSLNNHQHTLTPSITTTYGIFREEEANTYDIDDLEYQVNSGGWSDLNGATDIGSGWYRLDITSALRVAGTYRPVQESNTLDVRRKAAAAADKTVTVDALLSVRNIIQGIAYA